jgi:hypothetical protein
VLRALGVIRLSIVLAPQLRGIALGMLGGKFTVDLRAQAGYLLQLG